MALSFTGVCQATWATPGRSPHAIKRGCVSGQGWRSSERSVHAAQARQTLPRRAHRHLAGLILVLTVFGTELTPGSWAFGQQRDGADARSASAQSQAGNGEKPPSGLAVAMAMEQLLVDAIAKAERSVVAVARIRTDRLAAGAGPRPPFPIGAQPLSPTDADFVPNEYGAGVVVGREGHILTNYHLLGDPQKSEYVVWSQGRPFTADIIAADRWYDLAVLSTNAKGLQPIEFGDASGVRKGHIVIALGNPHAIAHDGDVSASWGIVSNSRRRAPRVPRRSDDAQGRETIHHYGTLIQTDAKLNLGFSGGALIDLRGRMIGLTTSYSAGLGYETSAGFAIPVDAAFRRAVELLREGRQPSYGFLGVKPEPLPLARRQQGILGARLADVFPGTPARRAGLRKGDVVVRIDGQRVRDDDDLIRIIGSLPPDATTVVSVIRANSISGNLNTGNVAQIDVSLSKKRIESRRPAIGTTDQRRWRGLQVESVSAVAEFEQIADFVDRRGSVYVQDVLADSPGWTAGIRTGYLVNQVNGQHVLTPDEFFAITDAVRGDVELQVVDKQGSIETRTVSP